MGSEDCFDSPQVNVFEAKKIGGVSAMLLAKTDHKLQALNDQIRSQPPALIDFLMLSKEGAFKPQFKDYKTIELYDELMLVDFESSLVDYLLIKVDRASMAFGLESREPLLDYRLIEWGAQLPVNYKLDDKSGKKIIKDIVYKHLPKQLMDRPKVGFDLPIFKWLKKELRYLLEDTFTEQNLKKSGLINVGYAIKMKEQFLNGNKKTNDIIWRIIVFQLWYKKWFETKK